MGKPLDGPGARHSALTSIPTDAFLKEIIQELEINHVYDEIGPRMSLDVLRRWGWRRIYGGSVGWEVDLELSPALLCL